MERDLDFRDGFYFLGNHPALDFVNTLPMLDGEFVDLLPDFVAFVRWLRAARFLEAKVAAQLIEDWGSSGRGRQVAEYARELREKVRKEVAVWEQGHPVRPALVAELNLRMKEHPMLTRISRSGGSLVTEFWFPANGPEDVMAPLAHFAAELFTQIEPARVRKCANCVLRFHDSSKKGTRRWCSMQLCGNRHKVAAYAKRKRAVEQG